MRGILVIHTNYVLAPADKDANNVVFDCRLHYANILNNIYFDNMRSQIYPSELKLNKANIFDTDTCFGLVIVHF